MFHYIYELAFNRHENEEKEISEELRGWNYANHLLKPRSDHLLPISLIASSICPTRRDAYLYAKGERGKPNAAMLEGKLCHQLLRGIVSCVKDYLIFQPDGANLREYLKEVKRDEVAKLLYQAKELKEVDVKEKLSKLWDYEATLCIALFRYYSNRFKRQELLHRLLPIVVEQKIDGSKIGLSRDLRADVVYVGDEKEVVDVKVGGRRWIHRIGIAGYALAIESLWKLPVDMGCLIYIDFNGSDPLLNCERFVIGDELRRKFIKLRDEKALVIEKMADPGKPVNCHPFCPFFSTCHQPEQPVQRSS